MLLIFDLDDTLIPTSQVLTPKRLEKALQLMIASGLKVEFEAGKKRLLTMNEEGRYSKEVLEQFVNELEGSDAHKELAFSVLDESLSGIEEESGINQFLRELKGPRVIVTAGKERLQQEKVDYFGIDRSLFEEIVVAEKGKKGEVYSRLKEKFGQFLVVGDRIVDDLSSAKKLGGITIHIRQGRGKIEPRNHPDVDYEIATIQELKGILENIQI